MGRLQLMGRHPTNLDAVLSLVEQTMAIPRMVPRINDPERSSVAPVPSRLFLSNVQPPTDNEVETNTSALKQEEEEEEEKEKEEGEEEDDDDENLEDDEVQEDAHRRQTDQLQKSQQLNKGLDSFSTNSAVQKPRFPYVLADSEFAPVDISSANFFNAKTRTNQLVAYARPGPNTLSLLLEACIGMRAPAAAQDYWGLLTASASDGGYNVEPDAENYFMYLRLLRLKRASRAAVDLVEEKIGSPDQGVDKSGMLVLGPVEAKHGREMAVAKTFRIAMSVCARDKSNPNALGYATRILRLMQARLPEPDLPALGMYLDVASAAGDRRQAAAGEKVGCKRLLEALNVVELSLQNLKSLLSYGYGDLAVERKWGKEGGAEGKGEANKSQDEGGNDRAPTGTGKRAWGADRKVAAEDAQGSSEKASREQQLKGIRVTDKGRAEVMELVRKLISAYDRVLASGKEELDRTQRYQCLRRKSTWAAYASRYYSHVTKNGVRRGVRRTSRGLKVGRKDGDDEGRGVMKER
ncbi:hypothetical protein MMC08_001437 [Hypocenomyce scalaris]|nr:hypothetical protein [Hypocenomyce scalaris]